MVVNGRVVHSFVITPGQRGDAPVGRELIRALGPEMKGRPIIADRAYQGDETRALVEEMGLVPVIPPTKNRREPWEYDKELYAKRNEIERLFRRLKEFRRACTRYDKLDTVFQGFVTLAFIMEALR